MAKKKIKNKNTMATGNELVNLIKIIVIICVVLLIFYFITLFVNKNNSDTSGNYNDTVATIQYDEIIVGEILNRNEKEYLVLVKKENDVNSNLYQSYLSIYSDKENAVRVYSVDLGSIFNANSIGDATILENGVENFKFSDSTLLRVNDGIITDSLIGNEQIENYLQELIK